MSVIDILETAQYVVDKSGQQTAVLLDLPTWRTVERLLQEMAEDERLGELITAANEDEKFDAKAAQEIYQTYLNDF